MWSNVPLAVCFRKDLPLQQRSIHTRLRDRNPPRRSQIQHGFDCCDAQLASEMGQNEPCHSLRRHGRATSDCMSFPERATHPRYYGEGYPHWPGKASNKEGEPWIMIAGLSSESIRQSSPIPFPPRPRDVLATFPI